MGASLAGTQARERLNAGGISLVATSDEGAALDPQAFEKA